MEAGQLWRQYIIAGAANIGALCIGFCLGWTSPVNPILTNPNSTILETPPTPDQISWIGSLLTIGAIFGPFVGGFAASKIGRKWGMLSAAIPLVIGFILMLFASGVGMIYAGRVFWGLALGIIFTAGPMYCAEIATDDSRGALGSFLQLFVTFGFVIVYSAGPFVSYDVVQYIGIAWVVVFVLCFFMMPESPFYHMYRDDSENAANYLMKIRGKSRDGVQAELDLIAANVRASLEKTAKFTDLFRGSNFKAFYISCTLLAAQQLCGINAVLFYMTDIFDATGSDLSPAIATIIIGVVQVIASAITPLVVDKLGRRIMLLISTCGTAVGLGLLGMFFILQSQDNPAADNLGFLPVLALVLFIITYCWGLGPLPWAVMSELFPIEVKAVASPIATAFCWMLSFLVTRFFGPVALAMGQGETFLVFGVCCVLAFFFVLFVVPETKGKSFQEIQNMLAGKPSKADKI